MVFHDGPVPYLSFPLLDRAGIRHGYTTRLGGVSTGYFAEMHLAALKEPPEIILENYRRIAEALHMDEKRVVLTYQTHSSGIRVVTEADAKEAASGYIVPGETGSDAAASGET